MLKVAVPTYDNIVAPCFEAAKSFVIITLENGRKISSRMVNCSGPEGFRRVRLLRVHSADILICNGIKGLYRDMLTALGLTVIHNISTSVDRALQQFLNGEICPETHRIEEISHSCEIPHEELVNWTIRLFESNGFCVSPSPGKDFFLIDLMAEIKCPKCHKPVRVAVCCGAHTYSTNLEIREFHCSTPAEYHARVYVHPADEAVSRCCREYGVELIDPLTTEIEEVRSEGLIPVLKETVRDHEPASGAEGRSKMS